MSEKKPAPAPAPAQEDSQPAAPAATLEQNVQAAVDKWYVDNMHGSVVSRDIDVHNLIHNAKPALVKAIVAAVGQNHTKE